MAKKSCTLAAEIAKNESADRVNMGESGHETRPELWSNTTTYLASRHRQTGIAVEPNQTHLAEDEVNRQVVLVEADVRVGVRCRKQCALNLAPRHVRGMHDAAVAVPALPRQVQRAVGTRGEGGAHGSQLQHQLRALAAHRLHRPAPLTTVGIQRETNNGGFDYDADNQQQRSIANEYFSKALVVHTK